MGLYFNKMSNLIFDYIIVGQGLAGTTLAHLLLNEGKKILVLDDAPEQSSSLVAGGLYNPLTGQRITKTWFADEMFPLIEPFYQDLEQKLQAKLLHQLPIYRPFLSEAASQTAYTRLQPADIEQYIAPAPDHVHFGQWISNEWGGFVTKHCGYVDMATLILESRGYFEQKQCFQQETFDFEKLEIADNQVKYKDFYAEKIIFCEGYHTQQNNPFFKDLPFLPVKGELLYIEADLPQDIIWNNGEVFIAPLSNGTFRVGATYEWNFPHTQPTAAAREKLETGLNHLLKVPYKVLAHKAGIRPAIKGRRPVMGSHEQHHNILIFNALGTKGISHVPYWGKHFCQYLSEKTPLHPEVNVQRFVGIKP